MILISIQKENLQDAVKNVKISMKSSLKRKKLLK
jgi:hypothetical protein